MNPTPSKPRRAWLWIGVAFVAGLAAVVGLALLLTSIQTHKAEQVQYPLKVVQVAANELDPAVWGKNYPREYDSFLKSKDDTIKTTYGGSVPFNKLDLRPA